MLKLRPSTAVNTVLFPNGHGEAVFVGPATVAEDTVVTVVAGGGMVVAEAGGTEPVVTNQRCQ